MNAWLMREAEEASPPVPKRRIWLKVTLAVCMILALCWFLYPLAFWIGVLFLVSALIMIIRGG